MNDMFETEKLREGLIKAALESEKLRHRLAEAQAENARLTSAMNKAVSQLGYVTFHSAHAAELILKRALAGEEFLHIGIETPTPPAPESVTLEDWQVTWLAKRLQPDFTFEEWDTGNQPMAIFQVLDGATAPKGREYTSFYKLVPAHNTPANRAAIAKRRDELKGE